MQYTDVNTDKLRSVSADQDWVIFHAVLCRKWTHDSRLTPLLLLLLFVLASRRLTLEEWRRAQGLRGKLNRVQSLTPQDVTSPGLQGPKVTLFCLILNQTRRLLWTHIPGFKPCTAEWPDEVFCPVVWSAGDVGLFWSFGSNGSHSFVHVIS